VVLVDTGGSSEAASEEVVRFVVCGRFTRLHVIWI